MPRIKYKTVALVITTIVVYHTGLLLLESSLLKDFYFSNGSSDSKIQMLNFLQSIDAFLIDINLLKTHEHLTLNDEQYLADKNLIAKMNRFTFGVFFDRVDIDYFFPPRQFKIVKAFGTNYSIDEVEKKVVKTRVLTNLYLISHKLLFQISIFYPRGTFYWIGADEASEKKKPFIPFWFGDVPRAMNSFERKTVFNGENVYTIPSKLDKFIFQYNYSEFKECDRKLVLKNRQRISDYKQNQTVNDRILPPLMHVINIIEGLDKRYWLAGGTLLGWYRDCGVIPHTTDADVFILFDEYDDKFRKMLIGNPVTPIIQTFGTVDNHFEMRTIYHRTQIDVFVVYDHNATHRYVGFHLNRNRLTRWIPVFDLYNELCSGDMLGYKVTVPCDTVKYLDFEYNPRDNWVIPLVKFHWSNMDRSYHTWTDDEWPHAYKAYFLNGTFDRMRTIRGIKRLYKDLKDITFDGDVVDEIILKANAKAKN